MIKKLLHFIVILFSFNLLIGQSIDATLLELQFSNDGYPEKFTKVENGFFFSSVDDQLWFTDGTIEKTYMVKDFDSGLYDDVSSLTPFGKKVFFVAELANDNRELWVSDGTEEGTIQLTDRNVGFTNENIYDIIEYKGKIYFGAYSNDYGYDLWVSDGTPLGTFVFKDLQDVSANRSPGDFFIFNEKLFFKAQSDAFGIELWTSDGTEEGTILLKDIKEGNQSGVTMGQDYTAYGDSFYFFANNGITGSELWKSDGTNEGTQLVKQIGSSYNSSSNNMTGAVINNKLIFIANDGISGKELWITNGTSEGTTLFKDINPGAASGIGYDVVFKLAGERLFFTASDGNSQSGLWVSDGTDTGTVFVNPVQPYNLMGANTSGSYVVFFAPKDNNNNDTVLWKSDGTPNGTIILSEEVKVTNISVSEQDFLMYDDRIFFNGKNGFNGNELWVTDGTPAGTKLFLDVNHSSGIGPNLLTAVGDKVFFRGVKDGYYGLYASDGTIEGTRYLKINSDSQSIHEESEFIDFNGKLVVSANDGVHGYELWISDGSQEGTFMIKDINPGSAGSMLNSAYIKSFLVYNDKLYFHADDGSGRGIWVTDGTRDGTYKVTVPGMIARGGYNGTTAFTGFQNDIYFYGTNGSLQGLYKINTTTKENTFIRSFVSIEYMAATNNTLFIIQDNGRTTYPEAAWELWASNGTSQGTLFLMDFADDDIDHITTFKDDLYFAAKIKQDPWGQALFKSDGTIEGTIPIFTGKIPTSSYPAFQNLMACGDYLYFGVENDYGYIGQLWKTDGTVAGTDVVINGAGDIFNNLNEFTCFKDNLLFKEYINESKIGITTGQSNEVYKLDVTSSANNKTEFIAPNGLTVAQDKLYFTANTNVSGSEIYVASVLNIKSNGTLQDNDTDEIVDLFDKCPSTPAGETVNDDGCSENQLDDDNDGITNNLDQCPYTLPGETVDANGCSESDLLDSDNDGVKDSLDFCAATPQGETVDENGCSQSQLDDDEDGVMNNLDLCPGTFNYEVDANGCPIQFNLPSNNFSIETTGVTCVDKNNGKLMITAIEAYSYVASVNGNNYEFTSELVIENLYAGNYQLCITIKNQLDFIKCFNFEVATPTEISGKSSTSKSNRTAFETIEMYSGTPPYSVSINGHEALTTMASIFTIEVKDGDKVNVVSKFPCEGVYEKKINIKNMVILAPNPTSDMLFINLPENQPNNINISIYNSYMQLVKSGEFINENSRLKLSLQDLPTGIYYLKLTIDEPLILKVIKK